MYINNVLTAAEAAEMWKLDLSTVKKACAAGRFRPSEARKSRGTWLITRAAMIRKYGMEVSK